MMILQKTRGMSSVFEVRDALIPDNYEALMLAYNSMNYLPSSSFCEVDGNKRIHRIDSFLHSIGEHRRMMFALRAIERNEPPVLLTIFSDHIHIKLWSYLPQNELSLLESYAWPYGVIEDKLEWDMPKTTGQYLCNSLNVLGLTLMEDNHG